MKISRFFYKTTMSMLRKRESRKTIHLQLPQTNKQTKKKILGMKLKSKRPLQLKLSNTEDTEDTIK
jgi:hypothetical protein